MVSRERFDPEVYEFYKAALEGAGFSASFKAEDIPLMREAEITGHAAHLDPYEVYEKTDLTIPRGSAGDLPIRIFVPEGAADAAGQVPVILYFHGGGFIMGSIEDHDPLCGKLPLMCEINSIKNCSINLYSISCQQFSQYRSSLRHAPDCIKLSIQILIYILLYLPAFICK